MPAGISPATVAGQVIVVVDGVVLGDPVVEQDELAGLPGHPQDVLRPGHVVLQQPQDVLRLARRQARDPVREPADEQAPLTGQRMHLHPRVNRLVPGRGEDRAPRSPSLIQALRRHCVVVVVGVQRPQGAGEGAQRFGPASSLSDGLTPVTSAPMRAVIFRRPSLVRDTGISMLLITHDLGVAADRADRVLVLQDGRVVEQGLPADILVSPRHGYTRRLIEAVPGLTRTRTLALEQDESTPTKEILRLESVSKDFPLPRAPGAQRHVRAVDKVDLTVRAGQTVALVRGVRSGQARYGVVTLL